MVLKKWFGYKQLRVQNKQGECEPGFDVVIGCCEPGHNAILREGRVCMRVVVDAIIGCYVPGHNAC